MPAPILAFFFWLHLIATVMWIGGLALLTLVVWPSLMLAGDDRTLDENNLLLRLDSRFRPLANISLVVLIVTGIIQMDGDPHYEGFFVVSNDWSLLMLLKHIVVVAMVLVTSIIQIYIMPELQRSTLLSSRHPSQETDGGQPSRRRFKQLTVVNLILGLLVLLFTAFLTAL